MSCGAVQPFSIVLSAPFTNVLNESDEVVASQSILSLPSTLKPTSVYALQVGGTLPLTSTAVAGGRLVITAQFPDDSAPRITLLDIPVPDSDVTVPLAGVTTLQGASPRTWQIRATLTSPSAATLSYTVGSGAVFTLLAVKVA